MTPAAQWQMALTFHQQTDLLQHHTSGSLPPTFANEMSPVGNWVTKQLALFLQPICEDEFGNDEIHPMDLSCSRSCCHRR